MSKVLPSTLSAWSRRRLDEMAYEVRDPFEPSEIDVRAYVGLKHIEQDTLRIREYGSSAGVASTKRQFKSGDVLFGSLRPYFRKVVRPARDGVCSTDITVLRPREGVDASFLHYFVASRDFIDHATNVSTGTRMPRAVWSTLAQGTWAFPPVPTQRKIAAILSAYDDLIENNLRRIEILEEMARNLYREWFVKFRFPGHEGARFVESALGRIPEGWKVRPLGDVCDVTMGQSPKSEFYNDCGEGLPFHQGVSNFGDRFPTTSTHCTQGRRLAEAGDILFSVRAPVGRMNVAPCRMILGRGLCGIRHRSGCQRFLFHGLKERFKAEDSMGGGTIFKAVTKTDMLGVPILVADAGLQCEFERKVESVEESVGALTQRNAILRRARDLLLPKLVSGEFNVAELPVRTVARPVNVGRDADVITRYDFFSHITALPFVHRVVIFGSRARGDHEDHSDIDLAVFCDGASDDEWLEVLDCLREDRIDTLLKVDCVRFDECDAVLQEHVLEEGVVLYEKGRGG